MKSFDTTGDFTQNYKFLIGSIVPRPIAVISTLNQDGTNNIAPFSFFTGVSAKPMIIAFCPLIRSSTGEKKDTLKNIEHNREFVVNFVNESIIDKINMTSAELPYGEDEFKHAGLTPLDSNMIAPRRLKESMIHFECKLRDILSYGDQPGCGTLVTGEVLKVHIAEELLDKGRIDQNIFKPVGRGAGNDWIKCTDKIQVERLMKAQIQK